MSKKFTNTIPLYDENYQIHFIQFAVKIYKQKYNSPSLNFSIKIFSNFNNYFRYGRAQGPALLYPLLNISFDSGVIGLTDIFC